MDEENLKREIESIKKVLSNPRLGFNERNNLEAYLKSLEEENGKK